MIPVVHADQELRNALLHRNYAALRELHGDLDTLRDPEHDTMPLFLLKHATPDAWSTRDHIPYFLYMCTKLMRLDTFQCTTAAGHMDAWQLLDHRGLPHAAYVQREMAIIYARLFTRDMLQGGDVNAADVAFLASKHLLDVDTALGGTLLNIALHNKRYEIAAMLLEYGARCTPPFIRAERLQTVIADGQYDIATEMMANGVLHYAAVRASILPYCREQVSTHPVCGTILDYYSRVDLREAWLTAAAIETPDDVEWNRTHADKKRRRT